jgi:hypothetical protein
MPCARENKAQIKSSLTPKDWGSDWGVKSFVESFACWSLAAWKPGPLCIEYPVRGQDL